MWPSDAMNERRRRARRSQEASPGRSADGVVCQGVQERDLGADPAFGTALTPRLSPHVTPPDSRYDRSDRRLIRAGDMHAHD